MKTFWNQIYDWLQNRPILKNWFQKNKHFFLDLLLGIPYIVFWLNVYNKELLALRNNFRVTKKFLIAKFDVLKELTNNSGVLNFFKCLFRNIFSVFPVRFFCWHFNTFGFCQRRAIWGWWNFWGGYHTGAGYRWAFWNWK